MHKIISFYINLVNEALKERSVKKEPVNLYEPIDYTLSLGGKRIRPALLMLANNLFDGDDKGRIAANLLGNKLAAFTEVLIFDLPDESDPDRLSKEDIHFLKNS